MNAIKNLIVLAALAVVCYGVYHSITTGPTTEAPPEVAPDWDAGISADLGPADGDPLGGASGEPRLAALPDDASTGAYPGLTPVELPPATPSASDPTSAGMVGDNLGSADRLNAGNSLDPSLDAGNEPSPAPWYGESANGPATVAGGSHAGETGAASGSGAATGPGNAMENGSAPGSGDITTQANPTATDSVAPGAAAAAADGWIPDENSSQAPQGQSNPSPQPDGPSGPEMTFPSIMQSAQQLREAGRSADALRMLTARYGDPKLTDDEHAQLTNMLDLIAGEVIYSREHTLEAPYVAQGGETLSQVAESYSIPWELLAKMNGFVEETTWLPLDPGALSPGEELKVVRGPFAAVMDVANHELTLYLNDLYAGRFPVESVGSAVSEQDLLVQDKNPQPVFYPPSAGVLADSPKNPLGSRWIGLGGELGLHGGQTAELPSHSSVRLSDDNIKEVFDILSVGSRVVIRK